MSYDNKWKGIDWVPPELVDLQDELSRHPELKEKIQAHDFETFSEVVGAIAAELDIVLDGYYSVESLKGLCKILTGKLRDKRSPIILPGK